MSNIMLMSIAGREYGLWTLTVIVLRSLELVGYFFSQHIHIPADLVVGDLGINLRGRDMLVAEHFADRFQRYALR